MAGRSRLFILGAAFIALMIGFAPLYLLRCIFPRGPAAFIMQTPPSVPSKGFHLPPVKNTAFKSGEKLTYNIVFKGIVVGHSTIEVGNGPMINGRRTLTYKSKAESTRFFDFFYKVRDENLSTVDEASLFSVSFDQNLHEGHYKDIRRYIFDYRNKKFLSEETKKGETKKTEGALQAPVYDVLSALYFARTLDLTPGRDLSLSIYRDQKGKPLLVTVGELLKKKKTPFGTFSCLRVEPLIHGDSLFKSKGGGLVVWMTNDENKLPVLMEANSTVGIVRVKLTKWEH